MAELTWRKSTRSNSSGSCVEVAALPDRVLVRDSTDPHGPRLRLDSSDWQAFLSDLGGAGVRRP